MISKIIYSKEYEPVPPTQKNILYYFNAKIAVALQLKAVPSLDELS
jgi:hypothetical protein